VNETQQCDSLAIMTTVEEIEKAVSKLTPEQLAKFRAWFEEFQARMFDEQIERDAMVGKLDKLAAKARVNHKAGRREEF
jgi:ABC-type Zn uptake system ZnuABC Zn-binding protein ZnuA